MAAIKQKHGTMIVISPRASEDAKMIINEGKGKGIQKVDLTTVSEEFIVQLCAIDGALMMDNYGKCEGIGIILPNNSNNIGNPARGARFNSADAYTKEHEDAFICVVSEDGMVDFL